MKVKLFGLTTAIALSVFGFLGKITGPSLADVTVSPHSLQGAGVLGSTGKNIGAPTTPSLVISLAIAPPIFPNVSTSPVLTPACYKWNHGNSQCTKDSDCCSGRCQQKLGQGAYCLHR
jgi:hypothetical protein